MNVIFADFNNIDADGCLRFTDGTMSDLEVSGVEPKEGMLLMFSDGDLLAQGEVIAPSGVHGWRARIVGGLQYLDGK